MYKTYYFYSTSYETFPEERKKGSLSLYIAQNRILVYIYNHMLFCDQLLKNSPDAEFRLYLS